MPNLNVDGLTFTFPATWQASKYDEWAYYRNQFAKQGNGIAAVDVLAVSPGHAAYLIEVKDYRHPEAVKPSELPAAIANKVLCTLAAMLPASLLAVEVSEKNLAKDIIGCQSLHVVLHVEQPRAHKPVVDLADIKQKLKGKLRAIDPHAKIVHMAGMAGLNWTVT